MRKDMTDMRTIAIMNNKGGVGKTVTSINLADILARDCKRQVVLVDCDGQCNLTSFCCPNLDTDAVPTLTEVLTGNAEIVWSDNLTEVAPGLRLLPGSPDLYELDLHSVLEGAGGRYSARLRDFVQCAREDGDTDYLIFDCAPGYTCASVAALMAAEDVVIPVNPDGFSFRGLSSMTRQIQGLRRAGVGTRIAGVLLTQWRSTELVLQGEDLLRSSGVPVFAQAIRRTEKVPESTFSQLPVTQYSPNSAASVDYRRWVREYLGGELYGL